MAKDKIIATKDGITKEFGIVQWDMLGKNKMGWVEVDPEQIPATTAEPFVPSELRSRTAEVTNEKKDEKPGADASEDLSKMDTNINGTGKEKVKATRTRTKKDETASGGEQKPKATRKKKAE